MTPKLLVLDSQSLFDWLVFDDAACAGWNGLLHRGEWRWIFNPSMRAEFDAVARRGFGPRWNVDQARLDGAWATHAHAVEAAGPAAPGRLRCTDPDDQKFIDLAVAAGAHTLVSRDKALLKLRSKAAARHGLRICTPAAFAASITSGE